MWTDEIYTPQPCEKAEMLATVEAESPAVEFWVTRVRLGNRIVHRRNGTTGQMLVGSTDGANEPLSSLLVGQHQINLLLPIVLGLPQSFIVWISCHSHALSLSSWA